MRTLVKPILVEETNALIQLEGLCTSWNGSKFSQTGSPVNGLTADGLAASVRAMATTANTARGGNHFIPESLVLRLMTTMREV